MIQEKKTKNAAHFVMLVMLVMLLWVPMTFCYETDVCFHAGSTGKHKLHPNFKRHLKSVLLFVQVTPLVSTFF